MTQTNFSQQIKPVSLAKCMLVGAFINLMVVTAFLIDVEGGKPEWEWYWMVRPLLIIPMAGAVGGAFYYLMKVRFPGGWVGFAATVFSVLIHIFGLWISFVLGFVGTYWH